MKHTDVLETEYKEHYNQYRWIGQMQVAVLTFYGVVTAFAMAAVAAFRPQAPTAIEYRWPAGIMIVLGVLGIFVVGYGLFRSRTMQRRTAWYLTTLLVQMAGAVEDSDAVNGSALRFRSLCSTRGRFKLWDTMNIVILLALYSGEGFLLTGVLAWLVVDNILCLNQSLVIGVICWIGLMVITPMLVQKYIMDKETAHMTDDYRKAEKFKTLHEMQEHFGLPSGVEAQREKTPPA